MVALPRGRLWRDKRRDPRPNAFQGLAAARRALLEDSPPIPDLIKFREQLHREAIAAEARRPTTRRKRT